MILPLTVFVVACQPPERQATTSGPDVEAITTWLEQCAAAFTAGEYERGLTMFSNDALLMPPNSPPLSIYEARSLYQAMFTDNTMQITAEAVEVVVSGDLAVLRASYDETLTPVGEGEPTFMSGPWLIALRKQSDGSWKGWHNMWTVVPPPPPPAN
jgi:ketosteroid isomerase-like protein